MSEYHKILKTLGELKKSHPTYNLGKHLSTSLDDIELKHLWGMSDEFLLNQIKKYQTSLDMDIPHDDDSDIDKILKDAMHLDIFSNNDEDDEDEKYY
jgi:hypothetical protein